MKPLHVVVVGGGALGCCVAYHLARSGAATTLIERDRIGEHASGRNPGNLNPILATPPDLIPLALESFRLHRTLAQELATLGCAPYGSAAVRRVLVAFDEKDRDEHDAVERLFTAHPGFSTTRLTAPALRSIEPRLSEEMQGGLMIEGNRSLDSGAFMRALAEGTRKAGATLAHANVRALRDNGRRAVTAVRTESGEHACDALVLATGPWAAETRAWLGVDLAVEPVKGEMLRLRLSGPNITHDFTHGLISLYRRGDDELWVGVTREPCGFDEEPSEHGQRALVDAAARIMPAVRSATIEEHLAALRPATPTGLPVVGRAPGWDNVFVANGGGIKGMLLCTGIGVAIRDLVLKGETPMPVAAFFLEGTD